MITVFQYFFVYLWIGKKMKWFLLLFLEMEQQQLQPDPPNYQQPPIYEDMNIENIVHMLQLIVNMIQTIVQHPMQLLRVCTVH